jgi:hypothetical protein
MFPRMWRENCLGGSRKKIHCSPAPHRFVELYLGEAEVLRERRRFGANIAQRLEPIDQGRAHRLHIGVDGDEVLHPSGGRRQYALPENDSGRVPTARP